MASRRPSDRRGGSRRPGAAGPERRGGPRLCVGDEAPLPLAGPPWGQLRASGSPAAEQARPGSGQAPRPARPPPAAAARRVGAPAARPRARLREAQLRAEAASNRAPPAPGPELLAGAAGGGGGGAPPAGAWGGA